jgi:hypothetical protein
VECGRDDDLRMGAVMATIRKERGAEIFFLKKISNASDRAIDSGGPFGRARPTNVGVRTIGRLSITLPFKKNVFFVLRISFKKSSMYSVIYKQYIH